LLDRGKGELCGKGNGGDFNLLQVEKIADRHKKGKMKEKEEDDFFRISSRGENAGKKRFFLHGGRLSSGREREKVLGGGESNKGR